MNSIVFAMRRPVRTRTSVVALIGGGLAAFRIERIALGLMQDFPRYVIDPLVRLDEFSTVAPVERVATESTVRRGAIGLFRRAGGANIALGNVHTQTNRTPGIASTALRGSLTIAVPRFLGRLCIPSVFIMGDPLRSLFMSPTPGVGLAMILSRLVSSAFVPARRESLCKRLGEDDEPRGGFAPILKVYRKSVPRLDTQERMLTPGRLAISALTFGLLGLPSAFPHERRTADAAAGREIGTHAEVSRHASDEMGDRCGSMLCEIRLKRDDPITHHGTDELLDARAVAPASPSGAASQSPMTHTRSGSIPTNTRSFLVETESTDALLFQPKFTRTC